MNALMTRRLLLISPSPATTQRVRASLDAYADTTYVAATVAEGLSQFRTEAWDVAILCMPGPIAAGLEVLTQLVAEDIQTSIVILTGEATVKGSVQAMRTGCCSVLMALDMESTLAPAVTQALQKTVAIRAVTNQRMRERAALALAQSRVGVMQEQISELEDANLEALLSALETREPDTRAHSLRLCAYATCIAKVIRYPESLLPHLNRACMLHDIGKLHLPLELLINPGVLPASQVEALRPHAWLGERILNSVTFLRPAARMVRHHHERWDGSGYPDKLAGENIPLGSRILSIVDALDAITTEQSYRPAQAFPEAISEIARWSARQFDPQLIAEFKSIPARVWIELRAEVVEEQSARSAGPTSKLVRAA